MRTSLYPHKNNWQTIATPHSFPKLYYTCFEELLTEKICNDKMNSVALCNWMYVLQITRSAYISKNSHTHTPGKGVFLTVYRNCRYHRPFTGIGTNIRKLFPRAHALLQDLFFSYPECKGTGPQRVQNIQSASKFSPIWRTSKRWARESIALGLSQGFWSLLSKNGKSDQFRFSDYRKQSNWLSFVHPQGPTRSTP